MMIYTGNEIWFDDDSGVIVSGLHIVAIEKGPISKNGAH